MLDYQDLSVSSSLLQQWTLMLVLVMLADLLLMHAAGGGPFRCHHSGDVLNEMEQTHSGLKALDETRIIASSKRKSIGRGHERRKEFP